MRRSIRQIAVTVRQKDNEDERRVAPQGAAFRNSMDSSAGDPYRIRLERLKYSSKPIGEAPRAKSGPATSHRGEDRVLRLKKISGIDLLQDGDARS